MSKKCLCCGKSIIQQTCDYCGFVDIEVITTEADQFLNEEISKYKKELIGCITDISVVSYSYKWNEAKSRLEMDKKEELKLADGVDCYPGMKWTSQAFGQLPAGKDIMLNITYKLKGNKKQRSCTVPTVQCDGFWRVGVIIDKTLRLRVFLGTERNYAESAALDLELK